MVGLAEGLAVTVAPHTVWLTDAAGDDHVDLHLVWQSEGFLHETTVKAFQRTSVVACLTHGQHERLCGQGTALVYHYADVTFRHLAHDGAAETDELS